jgi:hypothetical protein
MEGNPSSQNTIVLAERVDALRIAKARPARLGWRMCIPDRK